MLLCTMESLHPTSRIATPVNEQHSGQQLHSEDDEINDEMEDSSTAVEDDRDVLEQEEELEKLLAKPDSRSNLRKFLSTPSHDDEQFVRTGRKEKRQQRRRERKEKRRKQKSQKDLEKELLYEMEEGANGRNNSSSESSRSSIDRYPDKNTDQSRLLRMRKLHIILILVIIVALFCLLLLGAYRMTHSPHGKVTISVSSNGTSNFAPTTILISLDGFRSDFLNRGLTPTLDQFIAEGISPKYMLPSFPSVTFPNHYTLVTGLYPSSHGVVGNSFWDPDLEEEFYYRDPTRSMQPKWWSGGEPLWVTAENQNVTSAIHMWPGSEAHIQIEPTYVDKFNATEVLSRKVDRILELLDYPSKYDLGKVASGTERPQFIAAYVPNVDADGHLYGPNSTEIRQTISKVDLMLHDLFQGLKHRNLSDLVNVVIVSDHGMATTSTDRLIQFDDLLDPDLIEHVDGWPLYGLRPKDSTSLRSLYDQLSAEAVKDTHFEVYLTDENMPERYHFTNNDRIAPLWIVPETGWAIVHRKDFDVKEAKRTGKIYHPRGLHGYDHENPLMRAVFVARGPAFPHQAGSQVEVFREYLF